MSILKKADKLREIVERMVNETGNSIAEVWSDATKELDKLYKESEDIEED